MEPGALVYPPAQSGRIPGTLNAVIPPHGSIHPLHARRDDLRKWTMIGPVRISEWQAKAR
jgi:hypothetical protein